MPVKGLGTAGAADAAVLTVQGIASMTPFQVADNGGSLTVDNAGTFVVQSAGTTGHDAVGAGVNPVATGGYASAAAPSDVTADNDIVRAWHLRNGASCVQVTAAGALIGGDATNGLDVDVTRLPALAAGTNNIGDVDVLTVPADPFGANADAIVAAGAAGSMSAKLRRVTQGLEDLKSLIVLAAGDNNIGNVDVVTLPNVTLAAGTNTNEVVGDAAHDAAVSGNPLLVGGVASAAAPADVSADGDVVREWHLRNGASCVQVTASGALIGGDATNGLDVDVTRIQAGDNTIGRVKLTDGTTVATVRDLASSDALNVAIVDASGNQITSFGGGTQYTENAAAATDPVGTMLMAVRQDTLSTTETDANGDNIAARSTSKGELYVKHSDTIVVGGPVADGMAVSGNPVLIGGYDGTNTQTVLTDTSGRQQVVGAAADGAAVAGNPVLVAGTDGTNAQTMLMDTSGRLTVVGSNTESGTSFVQLGAGRDDSTPPALADNTFGWLRATTQRGLHVNLRSAANDREAAIDASNNLQVIESNSASALTALQLIDDPVFTDDSAFTAGTSKVGAIGFLADDVSTDSVDEGDVGAARMTPDRKVITTLQPHTLGGLAVGPGSGAKLISAASTNATSVKSSAGQVYAIYAHNINAAVRYLKVYNKASAPTVGTDVPVLTLPIPGNAAGAGFVLETTHGIAFATGIAIALTTGVADTDTGAVAANEIVVNLLYK
jgi:hypothetical protein